MNQRMRIKQKLIVGYVALFLAVIVSIGHVKADPLLERHKIVADMLEKRYSDILNSPPNDVSDCNIKKKYANEVCLRDGGGLSQKGTNECLYKATAEEADCKLEISLKKAGANEDYEKCKADLSKKTAYCMHKAPNQSHCLAKEDINHAECNKYLIKPKG